MKAITVCMLKMSTVQVKGLSCSSRKGLSSIGEIGDTNDQDKDRSYIDILADDVHHQIAFTKRR